MKLIDVHSYAIVEFPDHRAARYATLSHTWGDEEVTFQDMRELWVARQKKGWSKIQSSCQRALADGLDWIWIDTCCIDKTSSAELSESINSMFQWYGNADICYAYLADVVFDEHEPEGFFQTRWFARGWTLQELIAPYAVIFYDKNWLPITSKRKSRNSIASRTGINVDVLDHTVSLASVQVAEKMKWAANRQTTRREDQAYCLLGIFAVHMPLLYGEGDRAFRRLQEEILKSTEDYTLLLWGSRILSRSIRAANTGVWQHLGVRPGWDPLCNPLARSPSDFSHMFSVNELTSYRGRHKVRNQPPQFTSRGLRVSLFLNQVTELDNDEPLWKADLADFLRMLTDTGHRQFVSSIRPGPTCVASRLYVAALPCRWRIVEGTPLPCILLLRVTSDSEQENEPEFVRLRFFTSLVFRFEVEKSWKMTECFLKSVDGLLTIRRELCLEFRRPAYFNSEVQWRRRYSPWHLNEESIKVSQDVTQSIAKFSCELVREDTKESVSILCAGMVGKLYGNVVFHNGTSENGDVLDIFHELGHNIPWVKSAKDSGIGFQTSVEVDGGERYLQISITTEGEDGQQLFRKFSVTLSFDEAREMQLCDMAEKKDASHVHTFDLDDLQLLLSGGAS
ncbi:HET domain-containing protein [Ilyonectria robusta]